MPISSRSFENRAIGRVLKPKQLGLLCAND